MTVRKRVATTDDLAGSQLPIDATPETIPWDPAGTDTAPEWLTDDPGTFDRNAQRANPRTAQDPDLQEFLQAIHDAKDHDSEFELIAVTSEDTQ